MIANGTVLIIQLTYFVGFFFWSVCVILVDFCFFI